MDKSSKISENEINIELTEKAKQEPKYQQFLQWAKEQGVIFDNIDFPVAFGPSGVIGIAAKSDIPHNTAFLAIPKKLMITLSEARDGELKEFFLDHPEVFKYDEDSETNLMSVYVLYEKLKGEKSFWYPYLNAINPCSICLTWGPEAIAATESNHFIKEAIELIHDIEGTWSQISFILADYPNLFPKEKVTKELFLWSYQAIMTRVFGWGLPESVLIPFGDFLNHADRGVSYHVINTEYEREDQKDFDYKRMSLEVDLSIMKKDFNVKPEDRKLRGSLLQKRIDWIDKYKRFLTEEQRIKFESGICSREELKKYVARVNFELMKAEDYRHIWYLHWYDSSESEDNDSEEEWGEDWKRYENEQKNEEEIQRTKRQKDKKYKKKSTTDSTANTTNTTSNTTSTNFAEDELLKLVINAEKLKELKKNSPSMDAYLQNRDKVLSDSLDPQIIRKEFEEMNRQYEAELKSGKDDDEDEDDEDGEDDGDDEDDSDGDNEEVKEDDKEKKTDGKIVEENLEHKQTDKKDLKTENKDDGDDESDSDEDFDWLEDSEDKDVYWVFYTDEEVKYKQGQQVFNHYGRRSNHFLMMWYGFALRKNKYDSLNFSMWTDKKTLSKVNHPSETFFREYISAREWNNNKIKWNNQIKNPKLSEEFRSKLSKLDERLMAQLRGQLYWSQKGDPRIRKRVYIPSKSLSYEDAIAEYAVEIYTTFLKKYKTTIEEDIKLLEDPNLDYCLRFAYTFRLVHKEIARTQQTLFRMITTIIGRLKAGVKLREAYMERIEEFDVDDETFIRNRKKLTNYLRLLHQKMIE